MKKLKATCDRILAKLPPAFQGEQLIGGIVIPENARRLQEAKGITELLIVSAGPDCKVAKEGLRVLVAKAVCQPIEYDKDEYMVFSEVTAIAIIETVPDVPGISPAELLAKPLGMAEIKAGLGIVEKPVDDSSALPA